MATYFAIKNNLKIKPYKPSKSYKCTFLSPNTFEGHHGLVKPKKIAYPQSLVIKGFFCLKIKATNLLLLPYTILFI